MPCMRRWRQLTKPILAAGVPHALVLGNHDDEANLMRAQIVELDQRLKVHSLIEGACSQGVAWVSRVMLTAWILTCVR